MKTSTHTLPLAAPKERTFGFLSQIENLPKWATRFCKSVRRDGDGHRILTPQGEIAFRIEADARTGIVDMYGGPSADAMAHWPARVVATPDGGSLLIFTAFQYPGVPDDAFATQCAALAEEFDHLRRLTVAA